MKDFVTSLRDKVLLGGEISYEEAFTLYQEDLESLCSAADEIRQRFCGNQFDLCTIINAKSGRCSEDCKYCAQSAHYKADCETYPLLDEADIIKAAKYNHEQGVGRFSLVTSGRSLGEEEINKVCYILEKLEEEVPIKICASFGLLQAKDYRCLYKAGLRRIHNNLETAKENFPNMCTTHSYEDKIEAIIAAKREGMYVCSGGIFGIGESIKDRISLALALRQLEIESIPINFLNPIPNTPYGQYSFLGQEEARRIVALYRFILPKAFIRLAGGRGLLEDKGRSCFQGGANACISGDMLTTAGISVQKDIAMLHELGFVVKSGGN